MKFLWKKKILNDKFQMNVTLNSFQGLVFRDAEINSA